MIPASAALLVAMDYQPQPFPVPIRECLVSQRRRAVSLHAFSVCILDRNEQPADQESR